MIWCIYRPVVVYNLWMIAKKVYGDGSKWQLIYDANEQILSDPAELKIGMKLTIPEAPSADNANAAAGTAKSEAAGSSAETE